MYSTVTTRPPLYPVERAPSDRVGAGADSRAGAPCEATRAGGGAAQGAGPAGAASRGLDDDWQARGARCTRSGSCCGPVVPQMGGGVGGGEMYGG